MRKLMISLALVGGAATSVAVASPAAAEVAFQRGGGFQPAREIRRDINQLENRIQQAQRRGTISPREAMGLRRDVNRLEAEFSRFSRNGLDRREIGQLRAGINRVEARLRMERRDRDRRRY